ncbi:MAG TPA: PilZ domain-containing protein [Candidatus Omnitrophota bacterium]|nr:PilZ domain-containing protein [Candidatus Omnitrophota bacterium]
MMLERAHVLLRDDRKDLRVSEDENLSWRIKYKQRDGMARIRDISASGMRIETDVLFDPHEECVLSFDSNLGEDNYIPQVGRLVWQRKNRLFKNKYSCGIKFVDADEQVLGRMRQRVEKKVNRFLKRRRITTAFGFGLSCVFAALIGYIVWFSGVIYQDITNANRKMFGVSVQQAALIKDYIRLYRASEENLADKTQQLDIANQIIEENKTALALFAKELEATNALLDRTEDMLTDANGRNAELNNEILALQAQVETQIAKEKSNAVVADVELSMAEYRQKLQEIKNQMRQLKNKEHAARAAALAEIDDRKLQIGNNGYFVRSGEIVKVNEEQYRNAGANPAPVAQQPNRKVEIDVTFFE